MYGLCLDLDVPAAAAGSNTTIWGGSAEPLGHVCNRGYVVISSDAFAALQAGSSGGGSSQFTASELVALKYQANNPSPFNLGLEEAAAVAVAVLGCWGVAVCWRELAAFVGGGNSGEDPR